MKRILGILISATLIFTTLTPICFSSEVEILLEAEGASGSTWTTIQNEGASGEAWVRADADNYGSLSLEIEESGIYKIEAFYSAKSDEASVTLEIENILTKSLAVESTGSNKIDSLTKKELATDCTLEAGNYNLKLTVSGARVFIDYLSVEKTGDIPSDPEDNPDDIPDETEFTLLASEGILGSNALWNNSAAQLNKNGSVSWTLGSDFEEAKYNFEAVFQVNQGERFIIYVNDERVNTTGYFAPSAQWEKLTRVIGERISLKANDKITLEIDNVCVILHSLKLIKTNELPEEIPEEYITVDDYGTVKVQAEGYSENISEGASVVTKDDDGFIGYYTKWGSVPVLAYKISVPETAKYRIIARVKTEHPQWASLYINDERIAHSLGDFPSSASDFEYGEITLKADEEYIFKFKNEGATGILYMDWFMLKRADLPLMVEEVYQENEKINDDKIIRRGTDYFDIKFSDNIKASDSINVKITGEEGIIPCNIKIIDNVIRLELKKTLAYGKTYTISVFDIESTYGTKLNEEASIEVTTSGEDNDDGEDTASADEKNINYENVVVKGIVSSGTKTPISGRMVTLSATDEGGSDVTFINSSAISGENGEYTINAQIQASQYGKISFKVASEYQKNATEFTLPYYSRSKEVSMLEELFGYSSAQDTKKLFINNQSLLDIEVSEDIKKLSDEDLFFDLFTGKSYDSLELLKKEYKKAYVAFLINEAKSNSDIENIFSKSDYIEAFGSDASMYKEIENNKSELLGNVLLLESTNDIELLAKRVNNVLESAFLKEYNKEALTPLLSDKTVYTAQTVELEVGFTKNVSDIKELDIIFKAYDQSLYNNVISDGNYTVTDNNTTITYNKKHDKSEFSKLGSVSFTAPFNAGSYMISVSGAVVYEITAKSGSVYTVEDEITNKDIVITVSTASQSSPSYSSSSSGGGGISSSTSSTPTTQQPPLSPENNENVQTQQKEKYEFSDISTHLWAEESIYYLVSMGVISESNDKLFNPDRNITREEFLKMIVTAFGLLDKNATASFSDVPSDAWYYPYVASGVKYGIIMGNSDGTFGTGTQISRQDMAVMMERVLEKLGYPDSENKSDFFADYNSISDYAKNAVVNMQNLGILNGMGNNMFMPNNPATRAQSAKVIYELMKLCNR